MADIRIKDLPPEAVPVSSEKLAIDGSSTRSATIAAIVEVGRPTASQAEAEAGTQPYNAMTPLTTAQAIAALGVAVSEIGVSIQPYSANLAELSPIDPGTSGKAMLAADTMTQAAAVVGLPAIVPNTMLISDGAGTGYLTAAQLAAREFLGLGVGPLRNISVNPMLIDYDRHYGLNTALFPRTDGGLTVVTRQGPRHVGDVDAQIIAWETYDKGLSRANMRVVYDGPSTDDRNFAAAPMGTRFGIIALRTGTTPMFLYSDDQGVTWPTVALTLDPGLPGGFAASPHGKIMRWPAAAGGNDTTGWVVYFYGSDVIAYATTVNNGTTWSAITQCINGAGLSPTEMAVSRVGTQNKWIMVVRKEVLGSNAMVSTSTNMTTWTALSASGINLSENPPYLVQDDDAVWLFASNRKGAEITGVAGNTVVVAKLDADAFYTSAGASGFGSWRVIAQLSDWGTGYMDFVQHNGEWIATINAGELSLGSATNGGACGIYMLSNTPSSQGLTVLQAAHQKSSLLNSCFQVWQSGISGTGTGVRMLTADGWGLRRTGSVTGHQWSRQAGTDGGYALRIQRTAANATTNLLNVINVINSDDVRAIRGKHCNISIRARRGANYSEANSQLFLDVYGDTTESQITTTDGTLGTGIALEQFNIVLDASGLWVEGNSQVFIPNNIEMVWVRVRYTAVGTAGAADYFDLDEVLLQPTPYKTQRDKRPYGEELALCQRYFSKTYGSSVAAGTVTAEGALQTRARGTEASGAVNLDWRFPVEMRALPAITVYSPATGASGNIANTSAVTDLAATSQNVGVKGATIINTAATTSGSNYRAHVVASALPW
jgi:hypothetical protein